MSEHIIVVAGRGDGEAVPAGLRILTAAILSRGLAPKMGWGLGGENGYGAEFMNDTFMMHPFCWCESADCSWCDSENPAPNFSHKASGTDLRWYKWIGRGMEGDIKGDWLTILDECMASLGPKETP